MGEIFLKVNKIINNRSGNFTYEDFSESSLSERTGSNPERVKRICLDSENF